MKKVERMKARFIRTYNEKRDEGGPSFNTRDRELSNIVKTFVEILAEIQSEVDDLKLEKAH